MKISFPHEANWRVFHGKSYLTICDFVAEVVETPKRLYAWQVQRGWRDDKWQIGKGAASDEMSARAAAEKVIHESHAANDRMHVEYMSLEWYRRECGLKANELLNAEHYQLDVRRRNWMLVDYMAQQGVPLDETGMREHYLADQAVQICAKHDSGRLEELRRSVALIALDARNARESDKGEHDAQILVAILKALDKSLNKCERDAMSMAEAEKEAAKATGSIPMDVPRDAPQRTLFPLLDEGAA
jgi:hypothetical protein